MKKSKPVKKNGLSYAYYVGCASENFTKELDISTRAVCEKLNISLVDIPEFACCGAGVVEGHFAFVQTLINARNFALAEKAGLDIVVTCSTCLVNMRKAKVLLDSDKALKDKVNQALKEDDLSYSGTSDVRHILWILLEDFGIDKLKESVTNTLKVAVAPYYGCHIVRPSKYLGFESARNPKSIDRLIEACGSFVTDFSAKLDCCGFHTVAVNEVPSMKMAANVIKSAHDAGASMLVVVCPFCHVSLDAYQPETLRLEGESFNMPVLHLTQLIGLALGIKSDKLGLDKNVVRPDQVIITSEMLEIEEEPAEEN